MANEKERQKRTELRLEKEFRDGIEKREAVLLQIKPEKSRDGKRTVWKDAVNGRTYGRILGGIAWPGADSSVPDCHLAILGEDMRTDAATGQHLVWILCEEAERSIEPLLDRACSLMEMMLCRDWILPEAEPEYVRVERWLKERRQRRMSVPHFSGPPVEAFIELNALMQARTTTSKTFFFGEDSTAATAYVSVPDADFYKPLRKYPQIACVLYPLGYFDTVDICGAPRMRHVSAEGGY